MMALTGYESHWVPQLVTVEATMSALIKPSNLERENLEAHVDLCAIRYESLQRQFEVVDARLTAVETKVDALSVVIKSSQTSTVKALIAATATIIAALVSTIGVVVLAVL